MGGSWSGAGEPGEKGREGASERMRWSRAARAPHFRPPPRDPFSFALVYLPVIHFSVSFSYQAALLGAASRDCYGFPRPHFPPENRPLALLDALFQLLFPSSSPCDESHVYYS